MLHDLDTLQNVLDNIKAAQEQLEGLTQYLKRTVDLLQSQLDYARAVADDSTTEHPAAGTDPASGVIWSTEPEQVVNQVNCRITQVMANMIAQVGNGLVRMSTARIRASVERSKE